MKIHFEAWWGNKVKGFIFQRIDERARVDGVMSGGECGILGSQRKPRSRASLDPVVGHA